MSSPVVASGAHLVSIPGVELCAVGVAWPASTGDVTFTAEDLAAAVAAQDDPHLRTPVLKLGHTDPRFDGEPAVGRVENLRLSDDGMTLLGDLTGVPAWLAKVFPSAFPSRSIEGAFNVVTAGGGKHRFILTALAVLGVQAPAIEHLADIQALYEGTDTQPVAASRIASGDPVVLEGGPMPGRRVAASVNMEDVRRAYYDRQPAGSWAWVREVWSDFLIVDDDSGGLFRVPWSGDTPENLKFGAPQRVRVEYVDAPETESEPALLSRRPAVEPELLDRSRRVRAGTTDPKEGQMDRSKLLEALGLPADATDDKIWETLKAQGIILEVPPAEPTEPVVEPTEPVEPALPEGVVAIDQGTLDGLKVAAAAGQQAAETLRVQERDRFLGDAVKAGKFPPARLAYWQGYYDRDQAGAREFIAKLAAGSVPVAEVGHASSDGGDGMDAELRAIDEQFHRL
jgi:hypothetical protein